MRKLSTKAAAVLGVTTLAVAGSGVAYAYWSTTGSGSGTAASSAGASSLTITQLSAPTAMAPGVASGDVTGTITNGAANKAYVDQLTVTITGTDKAGCNANDYGLSTTSTVLAKVSSVATPKLVLDVKTELDPKGGTKPSVSFPAFQVGFADDSAAAQDSCKGATPTLSYSTN